MIFVRRRVTILAQFITTHLLSPVRLSGSSWNLALRVVTEMYRERYIFVCTVEHRWPPSTKYIEEISNHRCDVYVFSPYIEVMAEFFLKTVICFSITVCISVCGQVCPPNHGSTMKPRPLRTCNPVSNPHRICTSNNTFKKTRSAMHRYSVTVSIRLNYYRFVMIPLHSYIAQNIRDTIWRTISWFINATLVFYEKDIWSHNYRHQIITFNFL